MSYRLFEEAAHRYDLHTPPHHYQDDHAFVLQRASEIGARTLLDVGCGTGVFLAAARAAGLDASGLDAAQGMVDVASIRLGPGAVRKMRMQALEDDAAFDVIAALSWTLNYVADAEELSDVLRRCVRALRPNGLLVAQIAHAPHATGELFEDHEPGPTGIAEDVALRYRFTADVVGAASLRAEYTFECGSTRELFSETHSLHVADARLCAQLAADAGLADVTLFDSYRRDPFHSSVSPWLVARREPA